MDGVKASSGRGSEVDSGVGVHRTSPFTMATRRMKENSRRDELREGWEGMSNWTGTLIDSQN